MGRKKKSVVDWINKASIELNEKGKLDLKTSLNIVSFGKKEIIQHDTKIWDKAFERYKKYMNNPFHQKSVSKKRKKLEELRTKYL